MWDNVCVVPIDDAANGEFLNVCQGDGSSVGTCQLVVSLDDLESVPELHRLLQGKHLQNLGGLKRLCVAPQDEIESNFESRSSYLSFKSIAAGGFNTGVIDSTCTALPWTPPHAWPTVYSGAS